MNECNNLEFNLITIKEFAKQMRKPESTIRTWRTRGDLPANIFKKIGGDVFIKIDKFKEWIAKED